MREIKFRFWSNHLQKFVVPYDSIFIGALKDSDMNPMQYTGLKDKNGAEIYEGDILSHRDSHFLVKWDDIMAAFQVERVGDKVDSDFFNWGNVPSLETKGVPQHWNPKMTDGNCEVIGNIYENPELLK